MKAILVIDMPKCCFDCDFWTDDKHCFRCTVANKKYEDNSIVQEWCPLRPLPNKWHEGGNTSFIAKGWNACLDEILGETEC